jgi:Aldehyde dehydrogenase family
LPVAQSRVLAGFTTRSAVDRAENGARECRDFRGHTARDEVAVDDDARIDDFRTSIREIGCSIICKPSEETPASVIEIAKALLDACVPPAAIAVVFGRPDEVSSRLIASPVVAKITFTGSIPVGKLLAAAAGKVTKPVTMELGGHAPTIVCGDVDPEKTADFLAKTKFANSGQICLSPTRFPHKR